MVVPRAIFEHRHRPGTSQRSTAAVMSESVAVHLQSWLRCHGPAHKNSNAQLPVRMIPVCQSSSTYTTNTGSNWCHCTPQASGTTPTDTLWSSYTSLPQVQDMNIHISSKVANLRYQISAVTRPGHLYCRYWSILITGCTRWHPIHITTFGVRLLL
jgi:hypothetical protein